jgi:mRNA interferase MazF
MQRFDEDSPPPRIAPRLRSAPRIRQIYWCDFPKDAQLPEFWKTRPVLILSKTSTLFGNVMVLPFSTKPQPDNPMAFPMMSPIDGQRTWVICDYIATVAVSRLNASGRAIPRLSAADFNLILHRAASCLPQPRD